MKRISFFFKKFSTKKPQPVAASREELKQPSMIVTVPSREKLLIRAMNFGDEKEFNKLLEAGADINYIHGRKGSILLECAINQKNHEYREKFTKALLEKKVDVKPLDDKYKKRRDSIIYRMAKQEDYMLIDALFKANANIDWQYNLLFKNSYGMNVLQYCLTNQSVNSESRGNSEILIKISLKYIDLENNGVYWRNAEALASPDMVESIKIQLEPKIKEERKAIIDKIGIFPKVLVELVDSYLIEPIPEQPTKLKSIKKR